MKKYKLINSYPNSPELETIAYEKSPHIYDYENKNGNIGRIFNLHEYPEFWEEIIEKDYEILSFQAPVTRNIYARDLNNIYRSTNDIDLVVRTLDYVLSYPDSYKIHSVKRLSDGEVFTIGDKIVWKWIECPEPYLIISKFEINNDILSISYTYGKNKVASVSVYFKSVKDSLKKYIPKKPLFTTEDGVDIFEDVKCYYVDKYLNKVTEFAVLKSMDNRTLIYGKDFSTKEAAEKYIFENKPVLSISDLISHGVIVPIKLRNEVKKRIQ